MDKSEIKYKITTPNPYKGIKGPFKNPGLIHFYELFF